MLSDAHTTQKEHLELHKRIVLDLQNLELTLNQLQQSNEKEVLEFRTKTLAELDHARKKIERISEQHQRQGNIVVFMEQTRNKFHEIWNNSHIKQESPWEILEMGLQGGNRKVEQYIEYEETMRASLESLKAQLQEIKRIASRVNMYITDIHKQLLSFQNKIYTVTQ